MVFTPSIRLATLLGATALTTYASVSRAQDGFSIAINGATIAGDVTGVPDPVRATDRALQQADVQISYDGLNTTPRLTIEVVGNARAIRPGDSITVQSELNYPAYVTRGEVQVIDLATDRRVLSVPITPNQTATFAAPEGRALAIVHRVYDARGRFDETAPVPLTASGSPEGVEEGTSRLARQRIPVYGGSVTVTGQNVSNGARVTALGERVATDRDGGFALQRILPAGNYAVDVAVTGGGQNVALQRDVSIPASDWFYVAQVDLTYGLRRVDDGDWEPFDDGRLSFFVEGRSANGWDITASADSGNGEISDIFRRFDDRDPRDLFARIDPADLYPTYGDDSTREDRAPSSGNLFVRAERDGNYLQWGDFSASLSNDGYVRNDRTLYGFSGLWAAQDQTPSGDPRTQAYAYAAQPDQLPQRDVLRGTGGSVYFLGRQDIARATETISLQTRDASTGRVLSTQALTAGTDYQINYIQGVVTLARPLQSGGDAGVVTGAAGEGIDQVLVANYEYTPTIGDVDGYSYGARLEGWVSDQLRVGVVGQIDQTGSDDQQLFGADVTWQISDESFVRLDYARSEGPGFASVFSSDGGLIFDGEAIATGSGEAVKLDAQATLADLGITGADGTLAFYFEDRSEGFSSLDANVTADTGEEVFWGLAADIALSNNLSVTLSHDDYDTAVGEFERTTAIALTSQISEQLTLTAGVEAYDVRNDDDDGGRTDVALRLDYALSENTSVYGYVQTTLDARGLDDNDRVGLGGSVSLDGGWTLSGEASDGSDGAGAKVLASYADDAGNTRYFGYELDPTRDISGVDLRGRDQGQIVIGGRDQVTDTVTAFGENTYDMFGTYRSLTSAYGLTFAPTDAFTTNIAIEFGRIRDGGDSDFDRSAISLGLEYATEDIEAAGRIELRRDAGLRSGADVETDTLIVTADMGYRIDADQRLIFSADLARTDSDDSALLDGDYSDVILGYAYRPAEFGRLNMLARYRYLMDEYGQRLDGMDARGPLQRSHVASIDLSYAASQNWTLGGKLGYRSSRTAATATDAFAENDAWLAVANARYHLVNNWDALIEVRSFNLVQADTQDLGVLAAGYRQMNENVSLGVGYNFGRFSDDLTDLVQDDEGVFINLVASF